MPKRKKSHEYCRSRFGLVSHHNKRRRMSSDRGEEECNNSLLRLARRRRSAEKVDGHPPSTASCAAPGRWTEGNPGANGPPQNTLDAMDEAIVGTTTDTRSMELEEEDVKCHTVVTVGAKSRHLIGVCGYFALDGDPGLPETDESFQRVMGLVALTSSLKLSEDGNCTGCMSHAMFPKRVAPCVTMLDHSDLNGNSVDKMPPKDLDAAAGHSLDSDSSSPASPERSPAGRSDKVTLKPVHLMQHRGVSVLRSGVVVQQPHRHPRHRLPLPPPLPRVDEPFEDSSDSDEGFCEPVPKRSHRQALVQGDPPEPDEGVNIEEAMVASRMRHRRLAYTNHVLDASLGCTCSLYWQMMSNQYGVPTKMYSMERSNIAGPFESKLPSVLGVSIKATQGGPQVPVWTFNPVRTAPPVDKDRPGWHLREPLPPHCAQQSGVFAVGRLGRGLADVQGMLGLCLQRAIHCNKLVFVFDCQASRYPYPTSGTCKWYRYCRAEAKYVPCPDTPALTENFAGLGPNELPQEGRAGIKAVFLKTFGAP